MNKFRRSFTLVSLLMVVLLLTGCIPWGKGKDEFTLTFAVTLEEGGEGKLEEVVLKVGSTTVEVDEDGKAEATVAKGEVTISATLNGYKAYEEKVNVTKDDEIAIHLELVKEEEEATEEDLVEAFVDAVDAKDAEALLDALQALEEAGLVKDVVEEYAELYLDQAQDFNEFAEFAAQNGDAAEPPFLKNAADIQGNVVDPVNNGVAATIQLLNKARIASEFSQAFGKLSGWSLLEVPEEVSGESDFHEVLRSFVGKYPSMTIADLQNIVDGVVAKFRVEALFKNVTADKLELRDGVDQKTVDEVAEFVAELKIAALKAELQVLIAKAQALVDEGVLEVIIDELEKLFTVPDDKELKDLKPAEIKGLKDYGEQARTAIDNAVDLLEEYRGTKPVAYLYALIERAEELVLVHHINTTIADFQEKEDSEVSVVVSLIIDDLDIDAFASMTLAQWDDAAERFANALEKDEDTEVFFTSSQAFVDAVEDYVDEYLGILADVNAAKTKEAMEAVLTAHGLLDKEMPKTERLAKALEVINAAEANEAPFETIRAIELALMLQTVDPGEGEEA